MNTAWHHSWLLADQAGGGLLPMLTPFLMIALLFYFLILRPQNKSRDSHAQMLAGLKKNDRVVTIGGIQGVVVALRKDQDRVTLRVDDDTNTRIEFELSAIKRLAKPEAESPPPSKES